MALGVQVRCLCPGPIGIKIGQNEGVGSHMYLEVVPFRCTFGLEMFRSNFDMGSQGTDCFNLTKETMGLGWFRIGESQM